MINYLILPALYTSLFKNECVGISTKLFQVLHHTIIKRTRATDIERLIKIVYF